TISGQGLNPANVRSVATGTTNGATGVNTAAPVTIARTLTGNGTFIDPNWVIVQSGPITGSIPLPVVGSAIIRGTITDSQGQPFTGPGAFVVLYRNSTRSFGAATAIVPGLPAVRGPGVAGGAVTGFFPSGPGVPNGPSSILTIPVAAA